MDFHCKCGTTFAGKAPLINGTPFEVPGVEGIFWEGFRGHAHGAELVIDAATCPKCGRLADRIEGRTEPTRCATRQASGVTEHIPTYPHGVDRLICTCGYDSGIVPGALALPDSKRDWAGSPVAVVWQRHMADAAFAALAAMGWQPHDAEPVPGRDYDLMPGDHWSGCLCKWCTKEAS